MKTLLKNTVLNLELLEGRALLAGANGDQGDVAVAPFDLGFVEPLPVPVSKIPTVKNGPFLSAASGFFPAIIFSAITARDVPISMLIPTAFAAGIILFEASYAAETFLLEEIDNVADMISAVATNVPQTSGFVLGGILAGIALGEMLVRFEPSLLLPVTKKVSEK